MLGNGPSNSRQASTTSLAEENRAGLGGHSSADRAGRHSMLHIDEETVRRVLTPERAKAAVYSALSMWGTPLLAAPPRQRATVPGGELNVLSGALTIDSVSWLGTKAYVVRDGVGYNHTVTIFDDAGTVATVEAKLLGALRTAAVSAVATEVIHGPADVIAMLGAGYQAEYQLLALLHDNPNAEVRLWSRTKARADGLAEKLREQPAARRGATITSVGTLEEATAGADVITTLTRASEPFLGSGDVGQDVHINAAGSNSLDRRELTAELIQGSTIVVDSMEQAKLECGDLVDPVRSGIVNWDDVAELGQIVRDADRTPMTGRTIFESQGIGLLDLAAAAFVVSEILSTGNEGIG